MSLMEGQNNQRVQGHWHTFATACLGGALYTEGERLTSAEIEFKNKDKTLALLETIWL